MSIPKLDKTKFEEVQRNIFLMKGISLDTPICRYIDLDILVLLLQNNTFYLNRRRMFSDRNEHGWTGNFNRFMMPVSSDEDKEEKENERNYYKSQFKEDYDNRKAIADWLTICFTENTTENYFFWRAYTHHRFGIRICTSIKNFCDSIMQNNDYEFFIGKIEYGQNCEKLCLNNKITTYAFAKTMPYQDEREIRVYVFPINNSHPNNLYNGIWLKIDPNTLIEGITLSPFMLPMFRNEIVKLFPNFKTKFTQSKLVENKVQ